MLPNDDGGDDLARDYVARKYITDRASIYKDNKLTETLLQTFDIICKNKEPDGCLSNSVALQVILRSIGYDAKLCYGLCTSPDGHDFYHAWLEIEGKILDISVYGNSHYSPFWTDKKCVGPYVFENIEDTAVRYYDHTFDDDWKECLIYQAVQMGSVEDYINNAPNNGMWKLIFKILDETYSSERYLELQQYVSKEPM